MSGCYAHLAKHQNTRVCSDRHEVGPRLGYDTLRADADLLFQVSALFKDGTIGGNINIAIVGLILLEDEQVLQLQKQPRRMPALQENEWECLFKKCNCSVSYIFISLLLGKRRISYSAFKMTHLFFSSF